MILQFAPYEPVKAAAEGSDIVYDFHRLGLTGQETQPGWKLSAKYPATLACVAQPFGMVAQASSAGTQSTSGGLSNIFIDNVEIGTFNFYSSVRKDNAENILTDSYLTAGTHKLKLNVKSKGRLLLLISYILLTVSPLTLDKVTLTADSTTLAAGESVSLSTAALLSDGSVVDMKETQVIYSSSNPQAAAVSSTATVTAVNAGSTSIMAEVKLGSMVKTGFLQINITGPVLKSVQISSKKTELLPNETVQLTVTGMLTDGTPANLGSQDAEISFSSDKPEVAAVSPTGLVTAQGIGNAAVSAAVKLGGVTGEAVVYIAVSERIENQAIIYDFHKLGLTGQTTQEGWKIINASCNYLAQPFGITVQAESLNNYINLSFCAPLTSAYLISFAGTMSRSGGVGSIYIDGK